MNNFKEQQIDRHEIKSNHATTIQNKLISLLAGALINVKLGKKIDEYQNIIHKYLQSCIRTR